MKLTNETDIYTYVSLSYTYNKKGKRFISKIYIILIFNNVMNIINCILFFIKKNYL